MTSDPADLLRRLEERLLEPSVRALPEQISDLIADDFVEFGSSGRVYDKAQILTALAEEAHAPASAPPRASGFRIKLLADGVALVTYRTERPERASRRCSIWTMIDGRWQMVFHQGTPIPEGVR